MNKAYIAIRVLFLTILAFTTSAQPAYKDSKLIQQKDLPGGMILGDQIHPVQEITLKNGLRVLLLESDAKPEMYVNITYHVGSRHEIKNEQLNEHGVAHLLEHLLFKKIPSSTDPKKEMARLNIRNNGTTSFERTNYFGSFPSDGNLGKERLQFMLTWFSESMKEAQFSESDLATEMTVVRNEFERRDSAPGASMRKQVLQLAYPNLGYAHDITGEKAEIEQIKFSTIRDFYQKWYRPDNATLVIAGKFDRAETLKLIDEKFSKLSTPDTPLVQESSTYELPNHPRFANADLPMVGLLFVGVGPDRYSPEYVAFTALMDCLSNNIDGIANERWIKTNRAMLFMADPGQTNYATQYQINIVLPANTAEKQEQIANLAKMTLEMQELGDMGERISESCVNRLKAQRAKNFAQLSENPMQLAGYIGDIVGQGDWRLIWLRQSWWNNLNIQAVKEASRYLKNTKQLTLWHYPNALTTDNGLPKDSTESKSTATYRRKDINDLIKQHANTLAAARSVTHDKVESSFPTYDGNLETMAKHLKKGKLDNGMAWAILPKSNNGERVYGEIKWRWGDLESIKKYPIASQSNFLLLSSLLKASQNKSKSAVANLVTQYDLNMRVSLSTFQELKVTFNVPGKHTEPALELIAELITEPSFDETDIEQMRQLAINGMKMIKDNPSLVAEYAISQHIKKNQKTQLDKTDPRYVHDWDETEYLLTNLPKSNLREFYQAFNGVAQKTKTKRQSMAELALVGAIDPEKGQQLVKRLFRNWTNDTMVYEKVPLPFEAIPAETLTDIVKENSNAQYNAKKYVHINRASPDYPALDFAVRILGGQSGNNRLSTKLREQAGLTYGVSSAIDIVDSMEKNTTISISTTFAPQNKNAVGEKIKEVFAELHSAGIKNEELVRLKKNILENMDKQFLTEARTATELINILQNNRELSYYSTLRSRYEKVNVEEVNQAIKSYLTLDGFIQSWAGSFK